MTEREAIVVWLRELAKNYDELLLTNIGTIIRVAASKIQSGQHLENKDATDVI